MATSERMTKQPVKREAGYLYYLGKEGFVERSPMKSNASGQKGKVGTEQVTREAGYLYFIDKEGYVARNKK
ncbi:Uncharacterised protein [uncultured archaeon]|nr:Uncharacterised protein [uncultured archaeon]